MRQVTLLDEIAGLQAELRRLELERDQVVDARDDLMSQALVSGRTQAEIARATGLSTARISKIVERVRDR